MEKRRRWTLRKLPGYFLALLVLAMVTLAIASTCKIQVLEVGDRALILWISEGEVFSHSFIHSMYGVPVTERFRAGQGRFTLFHMMTDSPAALEYYAIEGEGENNVSVDLTGFCIPAASIGHHMLQLGECQWPLSRYADTKGRIPIRITTTTLADYMTRGSKTLRDQKEGTIARDF